MAGKWKIGALALMAAALFSPDRVSAEQDELFVPSGNAILVFTRDATGNVSPIRTIQGTHTGLSNPLAVVVDDPHGELLVADYSSNAILVFSRNASGDAAPLRTIADSSAVTNPTSLALDSRTGEVFVTEVRDDSLGTGVDAVLVFSRTASAGAALRTISGGNTGLSKAFDLKIDPLHDEVVVANSGNGSVTAYALAADGNAFPDQHLTGLTFPIGVALDLANNQLIVGDADPLLGGNNFVKTFPLRATGHVAPTSQFGGSAGQLLPGFLSGIALDAFNDRIAVSLQLNDLVRVFSRGTNAGGIVTLAQGISGNATGLSLPSQPTITKTEIVPVSLQVDTTASATSDGNGVLEPGEVVTLAPFWRNESPNGFFLTGTSTNFVGPGASIYTITQPVADYGDLLAGAGGTCTPGSCPKFSLSIPAARPSQHWDATFWETPITGNLVAVWKIHVGDSFTDVPRSVGYYRFVETLFHNGVTAGCGGGYCPATSTTRAQMAVFLLLSKNGTGYAPPACATPVFNDVPCSNGFAKWIDELNARGVTAGCGNNNYCPDDSVSRGQMAVFLLRTQEGLGYTPPACVTPSFADVPCSSGFAPWIDELAARGITAGCGGGDYCPGAPVTRGQMAVFLTTTFSLQLNGL